MEKVALIFRQFFFSLTYMSHVTLYYPFTVLSVMSVKYVDDLTAALRFISWLGSLLRMVLTRSS